MQELKFIKDYNNDERLRKSFFDLAANIFGISFENWYQKGFWNEQYIPFSFVDGGKIIANVSINILDLIINGEKKSALQIGTVMTHPDYRKRGLSSSLINKVLEEYEDKCDFMYLFANQTVLDFYLRFGFKAVEEHQFSMDFRSSKFEHTGIRKLNGINTEDINFIYKLASERLPVSQLLGTENAQGILMYYCLNVFSHDIYYLEDEDVIAIFKKEKNRIDIFDIISKTEIDIQHILTKIADNDTDKIVFHYTPDYNDIDTKSNVFNGSETLFIRTNGDNHFPVHGKHPLTSQA